jgi:general secretion pathway protein C
MQTDAYRLWSTRIVTFVISGLAAASAVYWGLKGWSQAGAVNAPAVSMAPASLLTPQAVARALGGALAPAASRPAQVPAASSRFVLVGVLAGQSRTGAALISVDGREAKPFRVGSEVDEGVMLQSVTGRRAVLKTDEGDAASFTLELPPLDK